MRLTAIFGQKSQKSSAINQTVKVKENNNENIGRKKRRKLGAVGQLTNKQIFFNKASDMTDRRGDSYQFVTKQKKSKDCYLDTK